MVVNKRFIRGRRINYVVVVCLYFVCRIERILRILNDLKYYKCGIICIFFFNSDFLEIALRLRSLKGVMCKLKGNV